MFLLTRENDKMCHVRKIHFKSYIILRDFDEKTTTNQPTDCTTFVDDTRLITDTINTRLIHDFKSSEVIQI